MARARRIKPIVAFSTETGRAAYDVLKQAADEEEAAIMSMGWGTGRRVLIIYSNK